jgi:hypothetical protein
LSLATTAGGLSAAEAFDKDAFMSRKKWYVSFVFRLQGTGDATKTEGGNHWTTKWDILREVTGTFELDEVSHHRPKRAKLDPGEKYQSRFISWDPSVNRSSVDYVVRDRVSHDSLSIVESGAPTHVNGFTKFAGSGSTQIGVRKEFAVDLRDMIYDFDLASLRVWNREKTKTLKLTGEFHSKTPMTRTHSDFVIPLTEVNIFSFLPELEGPLSDKLISRQLSVVNDKVAILVSVPVTRLPSFPQHAGAHPGGSERFNEWTTNGGPPLTLSLEVLLSPTPPSKAKLILKPGANNGAGPNGWRPLCSDSEDRPGNDFPVDWLIEEEGNDPATPSKVKRVVFSLLNTSNEPGVCMNFPVRPAAPAPFDLKFAPASRSRTAPATSAPGYNVAMDGQKLTLTDARVSARKGTIKVDCFDAGATGDLVAEAELEDGRVLRATVAQTGDSELRIPDYEPGVSWIARGWRNAFAPGLADDADDESLPVGDGQAGDGLTVWEEYRGFWVGGEWDGMCEPKTKDLFVSNNIGPAAYRGLRLFKAATELNVHDQLSSLEIRANRVINFNQGVRPHLVDQHCLVITEGGFVFKGADGVEVRASACHQTSGQDFPGPPKNTWEITILPSVLAIDELETQARQGESYDVSYAGNTIAHELSHGLGVRHHGDKDTESSLWKWEKKDNGQIVIYSKGVAVTPRDESTGVILLPEDLFGNWPAGEERQVYVGERQGTMSGDEACIMRYDNARAYRSIADGNVIYFHGSTEIVGNRLCTSPAGTGVNMPTHHPQSRYGGANTGRGDCIHKFVVSDRWEKKK